MKQYFLKPHLNYTFDLIQSEDFKILAMFRQSPEIMSDLDQEPESDEVVYKLLSNMFPNSAKPNSLWWLINYNSTIIGNFGLKVDYKNYRAEIGYVLFKDYRKNGHMTNLLPHLLEYAFVTLNLHSIEARINPKNSASKQLLLKFGFIKEAYFKQDYFYKNSFMDTEAYSLLKTNFVPRETI